jgi:aryl-phospho-beta-D-glucosidase BglC (GH1 family)
LCLPGTIWPHCRIRQAELCGVVVCLVDFYFLGMAAFFWRILSLSLTTLGGQAMAEYCQYSNPTLPAIDCKNFAWRNGKPKLANTQLVNEYGEAMQLRGLSSHGIQWFPNCVTEASLRYAVESYGINLYRIAIYPGASEGGYESNPQYFDDYIANIVSWCEILGIYVIIDWHVLNPGDPNVWLSNGVAINFWTKMASRYGSHPLVMYEISNEPNNVDWSSVLWYHNSIISTIRAIDPVTIIIAGTTTWSQDIHLAVSQPVQQPYHVMYTFHFYAASHGYLFSRLVETAPLIPIFVTEWGFSSASGDDSIDPTTAKTFLDYMAGQNSSLTLSWAMWSYADKDETSAMLLPNSCQTGRWDQLSCTGSYLKSYTLDQKYGAGCNNRMANGYA